MNKLIYLLFIGIFTLDWLAFALGVVGRAATWTPELLSMIAITVVMVRLAQRNPIALPVRYAVWLGWFLLLVVGWAILNDVASGTLLAGMRTYLKFLPFFLLPLIYRFSEGQVRRQLVLLGLLSALQLPVTAYQRFVAFAGYHTGDVVGGTLGANTSGVLSVYLACALVVLVSFYLKGRIGAVKLGLLAILFALPMMLNETKITLLLIPAAVFGPMLLAGGANAKKALVLGMTGLVIGAAFLITYEQLRGRSVIDFYTAEGSLGEYLYKGEDPRLYEKFSRFDSLAGAVDKLGEGGDLLLGVGAGNASQSFSDQLTGEYYKKYEYLQPGMVYLSRLLWELGIVGVLTYLAFFALVAADAYRLRTEEGLLGPFALAWVLITGVMALSFVYFKTFDGNLFGYLFWYYAGYLVGERYRRAAPQPAAEPLPALPTLSAALKRRA